MGEDACAIGRGTYLKKKQILDLFFLELSLEICSLGEVMTGVPREGVGSTKKWFNIS